ncbi:hypothetical protein [Pseudomonas sp. NA-150]|uniref:hypothetical protein n=1 Tax=Pseudomonas sp. NA-150 TaxID=3367525 RepID=UPI0037CACE7A
MAVAHGPSPLHRIDGWPFHLLNHPLSESAVWLDILTAASMRPFDIVVGLILLSLLIKGDRVIKAVMCRRQRL